MRKKSMNYCTRNILGVILGVVLFIGVNVLFMNFLSSARLDLTEGRLYTLSDGMRETIQKIEEPVTLNYYFSDKLQRLVPAFGIYGVRVRDFLQEITSLSKGKIKLNIFDPEPFSELEDQAVAAGLQGVPIDQSGAKVYFGLVGTNAVDTKEIVPFFQPDKEKFLEYDLAKLINSLATPKKPVIGIISSLPFDQPEPGQEPWMIIDQIRQGFITRGLFDPITEIDDDVDVMMLVHPQELKPSTLYALDQFMLRGGKLLAFVDPHSEYFANQQQGQNPYGQEGPKKTTSSTLRSFFEKWGIEMSLTHFVGDKGLANRVNMGGPGEVKPVQFLPWLRLTEKNINRDDMVTANLKVLNLASAGALKKTDKSTLEFTPLLNSTQNAMLIDTKDITPVPNFEKMEKEFTPANKNFVMAARLSGKVTSVFPDGPPVVEAKDEKKDEKEPAPKKREHLKEGQLNAIIVADTDLLENRFWVKVQNFFGQNLTMAHANNADFVMNALENLSGSNALISLRTRGSSARPFTKIQEIQDAAEQNYKARAEALQAELMAAEKRIAELQKGDQDGKILTKEQQDAIDEFRAQVLRTRKDLRQVKLALNQDINSLSRTVQFINIGLVPLFIFLFAIVFAYRRTRKSKLA